MNEQNLSKEEFKRDFELKDTNWFYTGMRRIWISLLESTIKGNAGNMKCALDLGCGAGGKTPYLLKYAHDVYGIDISSDALEFCEKRENLHFSQGNIESLPYADKTFSLVSSFDVLEHVEDDMRVLKEANRVMADDGLLVIALPAFKCLWGEHDAANFHKRRYLAGELKKKLEDSGFKVLRMTYVNFFLFPFALMQRMAERVMPKHSGAAKRQRVEKIPGFLNSILDGILSLESHMIKFLDFPFGVGILSVARKIKNA